MKLMFAPGACSIGIHLLLEEIGKPYETQRVNLQEGAQYKPDFTTINPKSKVPTLVRDDGSVLTEFPAIAYWLARTNPEAHLLPDDADGQARVLEALDYAVATMHMQGFTPMFRPGNFSPNAADEDAVKARGREIFERGWRSWTRRWRARTTSLDNSRSPMPRCSMSSSGARRALKHGHCPRTAPRISSGCWRGRRCSG